MSLRYTGAWMQDGAFNPLAAPTPNYQLELWAWGMNSNGQLGLGNTTSYSSPKQIGLLVDWAVLSIAFNGGCGLAIKTDGTLWAWGKNNRGQLGLGNTTYYSSPKQVGALTNWSSVSNGYEHTMAIKTDGTLWAWGANTVGQLGLGNTSYYSSPKQVGNLTNWKYVVSGDYYNLAIKTDGTLWSWGNNRNYAGLGGPVTGCLGLGNSNNYSSPKQVGSLTNWASVICGANSSFAIKTDGTLWSWGNNNGYNTTTPVGQLGLGNTTNYSSPKQVGALTNWLKIIAGSYFTSAIKTDGTLWSWGQNNYGQLGLGDTTSRSSPVQIGSLTNWLNIACGNYSTEAIKTDGTLWAWGSNSYAGSLGLGNQTNYSSPKQVGSLTTWKSISGGAYSFYGLKY